MTKTPKGFKGWPGGPQGARPDASLRVFRASAPASEPPPSAAGSRLKIRAFMPDPARQAAAFLLWRVMEEGQTLEAAMGEERAYRGLSARDQGFAAMVARATMRRMGHVETLLSKALDRPLPETAYYARAILRMAIGQYLEGLAPNHAIAQTAVALAKADRVAAGMAGMVNAIIRRIQREDWAESLSPLENLPHAWARLLVGQFGQTRASNLANALMHPVPLDLTVRAPAEMAAALNDMDDAAEIYDHTLRLAPRARQITALPTYAQGGFWVQDIAASLPALALHSSLSGTGRVLDMCAAPGGKTMQLAAFGHDVTALDISEARLRRVHENLERTGLKASVRVMDGRDLSGLGAFDGILLDAPCSATGTWRRHPEAPWLRGPEGVSNLVPLQADLMAAAAKALAPGGILVFSICSIGDDEAAQAQSCANQLGLVPINLDAANFPAPVRDAVNGHMVRTLPDMMVGGMDGFFIAAYRKGDA